MEKFTDKERLDEIRLIIDQAEQEAIEVDGEVPKTTVVLGVEGLRRIFDILPHYACA